MFPQKIQDIITRLEDYALLVVRGIKENGKTLDKILAKKEEAEKVEITMPNGLTTSMDALASALKNPVKTEDKNPIDKTIFARLETLLRNIYAESQKDKSSTTNELLHQLISKQQTFPTTLKIDEMQMRQLSNVSPTPSGGSISLTTGPSTNGVVYDGRKVVSVTNTAVALATSGTCEEVFITALTTNVDVVVIGGPGVIFTEATRTGRAMNPGDSIVLKIHDLKRVYVNGTAADGVSYTYTA